MTRHLCRICQAPAEVSWPVRNNPHCKRCVAQARFFLEESKDRHPKFGEPTAPVVVLAVEP
jgi:hypothetical protein